MTAILERLWRGFVRVVTEAGPDPVGDRWVVVDTETTGTDARSDRLLAIGGVALGRRGVRLDDSFELVLRSEGAGTSENIVVHGIGREAQMRGVPIPEALVAFRDWVAGAPLVGFHADFDRTVMRRAFAAADIAFPDRPWLDVASLAGALLPDSGRFGGASLDDWLIAFGIEALVRHNAAADALATAELLLCLRGIAAVQGTSGYGPLLRLSRQARWLGGR